MRIAIVTSSYPRDPDDSMNAGVFVRGFAESLAKHGHAPLVITPQAVADPGRIEVRSFPWPGNEPSLSHLDPRQPLTIARLATMLASGSWQCIRLFRRRRIEHAIAMWAVPSGLLTLAARRVGGTPYSVWALGSDIWRISDYPLGRSILHRVLTGAHRLYADGLLLASDVQRIAGRPCEFLATSRALPPPGHSPELDASRTHFLCVSRFHPHKGADVLLDALARIPVPQRARITVHMFGAGPEERNLRDFIERLDLGDTIRLGGPIGPSELASYLRVVRALIIPSRIESIPLILSDAAQAGCPVIATRVGDVGTLLERFKVGVTVPPESPSALAEAIAGFSPEDSFRPDDAAKLAEHLSIERSVRQFLRDTVR